MKTFWLCFVPLFVAVDAIGALPVFISLTQGISREKLTRLIGQSVATAALVALAFLAVGAAVLKLLRITAGDFMISGGTLLFALSLTDMLRMEKASYKNDPDSLGAVPIGVPLITGPAVLTTLMLLTREYGAGVSTLAILANVCIAGLVFYYADRINRILGKAGSKTVSKIASLLLAAIAVMMVRKGIFAVIAVGNYGGY